MSILTSTLQELQKMAQSAGAGDASEYTRILYAVQKKLPDSILAPLQQSGGLYEFIDIYKTYKAKTFSGLQAILKADIDKLPVINILIILHILGSAKKKSSITWEEPERGSVFLVNKRQLSEIFGVSQQAIDKWDKEGLPVEARGVQGVRGRENEYNTVRVYNWLLERYKKSNLSDLDIERTRLIKAQADKAEMEAAALRGELLPIEIIKVSWQSIFALVRVRILAIKAEIKTQIPSIDKEALVIIDESCKQALRELSGDGVPAKLGKLVRKYFQSQSTEGDDGD